MECVMKRQLPSSVEIEDERWWNDIEASLGSIADTGHEWDEDPAGWGTSTATRRFPALRLTPDVRTSESEIGLAGNVRVSDLPAPRHTGNAGGLSICVYRRVGVPMVQRERD